MAGEKLEAIKKDKLLASLPAAWPDTGLRARIRQALIASGRKVIVLDDDPTGTQTVHSLPVLTEWTPKALSAAWDEAETCFYIKTNSRRYPLAEAIAMNREIACNLAQVARARETEPLVLSRSDSTLRGHYPGEVTALVQTLEQELGVGYDAIIIAPFLLEGGRYTVGDVHWVQIGDQLAPAAQTESARDPTFGYRHSSLPEWVEEKTEGKIPASSVLNVSLETMREGGPDNVSGLLQQVKGEQVVIVNATSYRDLEVFVWGMIQAVKAGKRFVCRTAASFAKVYGGIPDRGLLARAELASSGGGTGIGGLTLVGSHVQRTTHQVDAVRSLADVTALELHVSLVLDRGACSQKVRRVRADVKRELMQGRDVILYTSRELFVPPDMTQLQAAQHVSDALVSVLKELPVCPRYEIGKGGITSSDLATAALGVRKAQVLGLIIPGVPVWRLGQESKYPGLPFVVFPGNVGEADALVSVIKILRGSRH